jgi:hypothetical protein
MLESTRLSLEGWCHETNGRPTRRVIDASTRAPLGIVRSVSLRRSWLAPLQSYRLEVLETEDEAQLMTVVRTWGLFRLWDLYDAEDNRIGSIYPPVLLDREGLRRGYLELPRNKILGVSGATLADFDVDGQRLELRFAAGLDDDPYLRMLLLGGVLTLQLPPR